MAVKPLQCLESEREGKREREPYWRNVCCRCNLCWCSLVQQCETTLRQRRDVWACCSASLNLTPTAAMQLELMGQRTGPQMVLWPHHPYTSHCCWWYKWISTILPSQKGEYLDFCVSVLTLYIMFRIKDLQLCKNPTNSHCTTLCN